MPWMIVAKPEPSSVLVYRATLCAVEPPYRQMPASLYVSSSVALDTVV
jgi:hypothetical protein